MLWIPVTIWAAFAQTLRNAAQRHLSAELGTLGATLVRFLYGLPFAALWLFALLVVTERTIPGLSLAFFAWVLLGSVAQIIATALLLRTMQERNFTLGVAYSKTEVLQVAIFALVLISDPLTAKTAVAVALGTLGVLLLSPADPERPLRALLTGWTSRTALLGLASGSAFALSAVAYRAATLALDTTFLVSAACTLMAAQVLQTLLLGGWLLVRSRTTVTKVLRAWRVSLFAGFMGAAASAGWFTAFALEPAAHVRTLGLVELIFSYLVSRRIFKERLARREMTGIALLAAGIVVITL